MNWALSLICNMYNLLHSFYNLMHSIYNLIHSIYNLIVVCFWHFASPLNLPMSNTHSLFVIFLFLHYTFCRLVMY